MAGLTLGIIVTTCFFIFNNPFQKKPVIPETSIVEKTIDLLQVPDKIIEKDTGILRNITSTTSKPTNDKVNRDTLVLFARSLLGIPYLYGSTDPAKGFDCSGFITYVFNHFKIVVPRSSYGFENIGTKRSFNTCRPGDVILFTGTDPQERTIGHIGIVCDIVNGIPSFIHSTSGKAYGVTITSMDNKFYQDRFIAVIDLLFQN